MHDWDDPPIARSTTRSIAEPAGPSEAAGPPAPATQPHPSATAAPLSEAALVSAILLALGAQPGVFMWRQNTGAARTARGGLVRFGLAGAPDIMAIAHGTFLAVECKSPRGRQRPEQARWQAACERAGGVYVLARSVQDAQAAVAACARESRAATGCEGEQNELG